MKQLSIEDHEALGSVFRVGRALIIGLSLDLAKKEDEKTSPEPRRGDAPFSIGA